MITKIEMVSVDSVFGALSRVTWSDSQSEEGFAGELVIQGIETYDQFVQVLELLGGRSQTSAPATIGGTVEHMTDSSAVAEGLIDAPDIAEEVVAEEAVVEEVVAEEPDYTEVYARLTRLADLVKLLRDIGHTDFPSILVKAQELQAAGTCPMLLRVDNLEKRLKTTCAALQVPMVA